MSQPHFHSGQLPQHQLFIFEELGADKEVKERLLIEVENAPTDANIAQLSKRVINQIHEVGSKKVINAKVKYEQGDYILILDDKTAVALKKGETGSDVVVKKLKTLSEASQRGQEKVKESFWSMLFSPLLSLITTIRDYINTSTYSKIAQEYLDQTSCRTYDGFVSLLQATQSLSHNPSQVQRNRQISPSFC